MCNFNLYIVCSVLSDLTYIDFQPNSSHLSLLKWTDSKGFKGELRILNKVCSKWKDVASLLGFKHEEMKEIERNNFSDCKECCREILTSWVEQGRGQDQYSFTWDGIYQLLEDLECSATARRLKEAQTILQS